MGSLQREAPWEMPLPEHCYFYHTMQYPDGGTTTGSWTIPDFGNYIGSYDIAGKTVLDVGTASGFLAFEAERAGADVTGFDAASVEEFRHFPFAASLSYRNISASRENWTASNLMPVKRSWWYSWHRYGSRAKCIYAPIPSLYASRESFDVVMAGAIVEHLSDPVYAVGAWTRVAREAVIIPFTEVAEDDNLYMQPITSLDNPSLLHMWWRLSRGLWCKVFDNLGFDVRFVTSDAVLNDTPNAPVNVRRPTIIATRRQGTWEAINGA